MQMADSWLLKNGFGRAEVDGFDELSTYCYKLVNLSSSRICNSLSEEIAIETTSASIWLLAVADYL